MNNLNDTVRAGKPAPSKTRRVRRKRPARPVKAEWIVRMGYNHWGIAMIGRGEKLLPYRIEELWCEQPSMDGVQLVGYALRKLTGETHHVDITDLAPRCDCRGSVAHGHCKHLDVLKILVGLGADEDCGTEFPDDYDPSQFVF